jgi:hypothetical protein
MTKKQYRSAMGKTVDMGSLLLQNEGVRAVGNMGVNARGDIISSTNKVIEKKTKQVQRHNRRSTNVSNAPVATSTVAVKKAREQALSPVASEEDIFTDLPEDNDVVAETIAEPQPTSEPAPGGLAAALARSRTVQQQLEKTPRQLAKEAGVRKI